MKRSNQPQTKQKSIWKNWMETNWNIWPTIANCIVWKIHFIYKCMTLSISMAFYCSKNDWNLNRALLWHFCTVQQLRICFSPKEKIKQFFSLVFGFSFLIFSFFFFFSNGHKRNKTIWNEGKKQKKIRILNIECERNEIFKWRATAAKLSPWIVSEKHCFTSLCERNIADIAVIKNDTQR